MRTWKLNEIETPEGTRSPVVLHSAEDARAVLVTLHPGQELGDHQVHENAWLLVVDGEVDAGNGGAEVKADVGTLLRFEPGERHAISSDRGARLLLLLAPWPGEGHYAHRGS